MEFVFDDCLMESIDVTSLEERDVNEIIRENAHVMLDCEMDLEDILTESNIEIVTESFADSFVETLKKIIKKIKDLISSFLKWLKSLFTKKKSDHEKFEEEMDELRKKNDASAKRFKKIVANDKINMMITKITVKHEYLDIEKALKSLDSIVLILISMLASDGGIDYANDDKIESGENRLKDMKIRKEDCVITKEFKCRIKTNRNNKPYDVYYSDKSVEGLYIKWVRSSQTSLDKLEPYTLKAAEELKWAKEKTPHTTKLTEIGRWKNFIRECLNTGAIGVNTVLSMIKENVENDKKIDAAVKAERQKILDGNTWYDIDTNGASKGNKENDK